MKPKTMILMVVAVSCGLAASYMTSKLIGQQQPPQVEEEKVTVLFATKSIEKLTILNEPEKLFVAREVSAAEYANKKYFTSIGDLKGKRLNKDLKVDSYISPEDVSSRTDRLPLDKGFLALGVNVQPSDIACGFVFPGDQVNVVLRVNGDKGVTGTLLWKVKVVSVGGTIGPKAEETESGTKAPVPFINLAVTPRTSAIVRQAQAMGQLSFALREEGDTSSDPKEPLNVDEKGVIDNATILALLGDSQEPKVTKKTEAKDAGPLGVDLEKIEKLPNPKVDPPVAVVAPTPAWTVEVQHGDRPVKKVPFFKGEDGQITREQAPAFEAAKDSEKK